MKTSISQGDLGDASLLGYQKGGHAGEHLKDAEKVLDSWGIGISRKVSMQVREQSFP